MNLPNKLTVARILMVIPFIAILEIADENFYFNKDFYLNKYFYIDLVAAAIFLIASLTDFLDGYIARKRNLITNFGKLMDPLSDKILVISAMVIFVAKNYISAWAVIIIISREFFVTGIRIIAASKGDVIPADKSGKYKTAVQMIAIVLIIFTKTSVFSDLLMIPPVVLTIWSGYEYLTKSRKYFD